MSDAAITQLLPHPPSGAPLTDAQLLDLYSPVDRRVPHVRANFVASVDGSATAGGLSGQLGAPADKRVFDLLRRLCDVVVVGAGTVRAEGYGAMILDEDAAAWRTANGLPAQPRFAIVSASLNLDPQGDAFASAPVRPLVLTVEAADAGRRAALAGVADLVDCGERLVSAARLVDELVRRGMPQVHSEGGPTLLGTLIEEDVLDELCLTISPLLEGGAGPRIAFGGSRGGLRSITLDHVLLAGSMMLTRYSRDRTDRS